MFQQLEGKLAGTTEESSWYRTSVNDDTAPPSPNSLRTETSALGRTIIFESFRGHFLVSEDREARQTANHNSYARGTWPNKGETYEIKGKERRKRNRRDDPVKVRRQRKSKRENRCTRVIRKQRTRYKATSIIIPKRSQTRVTLQFAFLHSTSTSSSFTSDFLYLFASRVGLTRREVGSKP